jgi:hypothetical protein
LSKDSLEKRVEALEREFKALKDDLPQAAVVLAMSLSIVDEHGVAASLAIWPDNGVAFALGRESGAGVVLGISADRVPKLMLMDARRNGRLELEVALNDCPRTSLRDGSSVRRLDLNVDPVGAATIAANGAAGQDGLAVLVTKDGTPRLVRGSHDECH